MIYQIAQLADIIDGDRGKNYPKQNEFSHEGYCLFLNAGNVTPDGFSFEENSFITQEKDDLLRKGKLQRGDIVYTTRGTVGNAAFYSEAVPFDNIRINSGMVILRCNEDIVDKRYLYHILKSEHFRPYFKKYCTGSAQPQLPIMNFSKIELNIPEIQTQRRIADILSAYDDLIENNRKQIKLLEEAAQRLYQELFVDLRFPGHEHTKIVDGVPEGWERSTVSNVSSVLRRGISPKYNDQADFMVINQKCIRQTVVTFDEARKQEKPFPEEMNVQDCDTVICSTGAGTLGRVGQIFGNYPRTTFDSHITLVRAKPDFGAQYLFHFLKSHQAYLMGMGKGSTNQLELSRGTIQNLVILVPPKELKKEFEMLAHHIHDKIGVVNTEIELLQNARDRVLPKLMSGEVEV